MKAKIHILLILMFFGLPVFAQQYVTVGLEERPIFEMLEAIVKQTGYRIYCAPEVSDSLVVSVNATQVDPVELLQQTLQNTPFKVSVYKNFIYIINDRTLITTLPESFYRRSDAPSTVTDHVAPVFERETTAISETLVYAIGNPNAPSTTNVVVTGVVTNFKTGESMPGVTLMIDEPLTGTTTDAFGFYSIQLPPGRQELMIRSVGMKDSKRQLMLFSDGKLDIEIEEQIFSLSEISIVANRIDNIRSVSGGMERLQMRNIKNIPTVMGEADILKIVMTLPGVKSVGEVSSGFNVRGGATDQNLILYNDGTIYAPTHLFGLFSSFNPDVIENMELFKSGIPAKYGGRISSVLEIRSREGNKKEFKGSASIGLLTSQLALEAPLHKGNGSFIVGGRTTYSDWLMGMIPKNSGYSNGSARFYDLNASANYTLNYKNTVYLSGYYSNDMFSLTKSDDYSYQNANFSARWRHLFNHKLTSTYVVGYDHYSYSNKDTTELSNGYSLDFSINQMFAKADFTYFANSAHTFNFGISSISYSLLPGSFQPASQQSLIRARKLQEEKALESAVYISDQWDISSDWMVSAGIRYSMFNVLGPRNYNVYMPDHLPAQATFLRTDTAESGVLKTWHGPEFRFSARYMINNNTSVKAGVNSMRQHIHKISNTTVMSPNDTWKLSDNNIRPQTGVQYVAGLFRNFSNNTIETSIEAYFKTMNNYLDYRTGARLLMNQRIETEVAGVRGRAYGVELMLKKSQGKLNGWVSYTWSRTMLRRHDELSSSANTKLWFPSDFDKPHEIKLVGNYKITHRYSFSLNCDYSTGRPITLPMTKYILDNREYVYYSERNSYRVPDFFRIDLAFNIEAGHLIKKLTHSYFNIGVYNLTGRKNPYSIYFTSNGAIVKGYKMSIFGAQIPYVSYNIKF